MCFLAGNCKGHWASLDLRHIVQLNSKDKPQFWTFNLRDQGSLLGKKIILFIPRSNQKEEMEETQILDF